MKIIQSILESNLSTLENITWNPRADIYSCEEGWLIKIELAGIRKDGPSAGVAMTTALASLYTGLPARSDTAMTGEITLSGLVLPVGGIKEKMLAAHRAGIKIVIIPKDNEKDLEELPDNLRTDIQFVGIKNIEELLITAIPQLERRLRRKA